tara:strand:+ start:172 stop:711 length:540 start_codon:yes stop_codon:yes gene_type:complete
MKKLNSLTIPLLLILSLSFFGCESGQVEKKAEQKVEDVASQDDGGEDSASQLVSGASSDDGKACAGEDDCLRTVNFAFDSSVLSSKARDILDDNANFLKIQKDGNLKITIEGHCDERGSVQYNLALGERRAKSVRNYLVSAGVNANNLSIQTYGKERGLDDGHNEAAWAKNRRANFVIQ